MANANIENGEFLTSSQAAEILEVSLRTVQLWVEAGTLRAWKTVGGHRRIKRSSVETMLEQRRQQLNMPSTDRPLRLMLLEDEKSMREFVKLQLETLDVPVEVVTAANGFEDLLAMGRKQPDLAVIDLMMPGMDGFEMVRALSNTDALRSNQIIVVTKLSDEEISQRGGLPEGVTVLNKPITSVKLNAVFAEKTALLQAAGF